MYSKSRAILKNTIKLYNYTPEYCPFRVAPYSFMTGSAYVTSFGNLRGRADENSGKKMENEKHEPNFSSPNFSSSKETFFSKSSFKYDEFRVPSKVPYEKVRI